MRLDRVSLVMILVALLATVAVYNQLPETIPRHWNIHGEVDAWSSRGSVFGMVAVTAALYGLFSLIPLLDRTGALAARPGAYRSFLRAFVALFLTVHAGTVAAALGRPVRMLQLAGLLIGLFFICFGNCLPQLKTNWFLGIRTRWTMQDEGTWRVTHRVGGRLFMAVGVVLVVLSLILRDFWVFLSLLGVLLLLMIFSIVFSWLVYRARHN